MYPQKDINCCNVSFLSGNTVKIEICEIVEQVCNKQTDEPNYMVFSITCSCIH